MARIDPTTNKVTAHFAVGNGALQRFGTNGLWLVAGTDGLIELDPATNKVVKRFAVEADGTRWRVTRVVGDDSHLWVLANDAATPDAFPNRVAIFALDDQSDTVTHVRTVPRLEFGDLLAVGQNDTFWTNPSDRLRRVDIRTGTVLYDVRRSFACALAVTTPAPDALWCTTYRDAITSRLSEAGSSLVQSVVARER
jgi:hypothetical protein